MADAKVTKLFDEREIAVRVEEIASKAVDRLPRDFLSVGAQCWSALAVARCLALKTVGVPSAPQCLIEISNQIIRMLDTDGKTD